VTPTLVYIAGPITKGDTFAHVRDACEAWRALYARGIPAYCPHWSAMQQMAAPIHANNFDRQHAAWLEYDFLLLRNSIAVLRLPGESKGADLECAEARRLGLPIFDSLQAVYEWYYLRGAVTQVTT
jgi:hypothetical protein